MNSFITSAAQGDVSFLRVAKLPQDATPKTNFDGVLAHSETGHDHKLNKLEGVTFYETSNPFVSFLRLEQPVSLDHYRQDHQHGSIALQPGLYRVAGQQEYVSASETRRVED